MNPKLIKVFKILFVCILAFCSYGLAIKVLNFTTLSKDTIGILLFIFVFIILLITGRTFRQIMETDNE
jgi:hypothetical protein